ncbi:hypothetical protein BDV19DRAFT_372073 [Aspergillus venezuelensis]
MRRRAGQADETRRLTRCDYWPFPSHLFSPLRPLQYLLYQLSFVVLFRSQSSEHGRLGTSPRSSKGLLFPLISSGYC